MESISDPHVKNESLVSDDQDLLMSEDCDFAFDIPITTPVINAHVASTHPAVVNTTDNSKKLIFSECISPGHFDILSDCNNANIEHVKQTHQQQQLVVYSAEQDRQMFSSCPPSQRKQKAVSKIPRPPNAFLLFANRWRRTLAMQYPLEKNKEISVRLGIMWKSMNKEEKDVYMNAAREVVDEHKRKYPDYVYCPKEARIQKALRLGGRKQKNLNKRSHKVTAALPSGNAWERATQHLQTWNVHHQALRPIHTSIQPHSLHSFLSSRMIAEQQRRAEETKSTIREQVEQDMIQGSTETYSYIQL
jgi:hypothetical protein